MFVISNQFEIICNKPRIMSLLFPRSVSHILMQLSKLAFVIFCRSRTLLFYVSFLVSNASADRVQNNCIICVYYSIRYLERHCLNLSFIYKWTFPLLLFFVFITAHFSIAIYLGNVLMCYIR